MRARLEIVICVVALTYMVFILTLVRRRHLREKYALLWLTVGGATVLLALSRGAADRVAHALGIAYGPSAVFLFSTMFLMAVAAHLSWEVSRLEDKTRRLAEEIGLLRAASDGPRDSREIDLVTSDEQSAADKGQARSRRESRPGSP